MIEEDGGLYWIWHCLRPPETMELENGVAKHTLLKIPKFGARKLLDRQ
jgi:hypothetical protein